MVIRSNAGHLLGTWPFSEEIIINGMLRMQPLAMIITESLYDIVVGDMYGWLD